MSDDIHLCDLHCHLLPKIDDGAADWADSIAMAEMAADDGIGTIVVTPHQLGAYGENRASLILDRTEQLQRVLDERQIPLQVLPGAEIRVEPDMVEGLRQGDLLTLANGKRYVLIEQPSDLFLPLDRVLYQLGSVGLQAILAHPERNKGVLTDPSIVRSLLAAGCLMQVTAGSLMGTFGPTVQTMAEHMVRCGDAQFLSTDAHGVRSRRPLLRRAFERTAELVGSEAAIELCSYNPLRVVQGKPVRVDIPGQSQPRRTSWFRWRKAG